VRGELQRLGLDRAILVGTRVIVLDDASSLDTATEVKVAQAFDRVLAGRTSGKPLPALRGGRQLQPNPVPGAVPGE